jgi:hypothetical protein
MIAVELRFAPLAQARFRGANTFLNPAPVLADWIGDLKVYESAHLVPPSPSAIKVRLIVRCEIDMGPSPYTNYLPCLAFITPCFRSPFIAVFLSSTKES